MDGRSATDQMVQESPAMFLEGWRTGDAGKILRSIADDFVYDDPVDGRLEGAPFAVCLPELFGTAGSPEDGAGGFGFEDVADVVAQEEDGELTAWGWWKTVSEEGAGLVKVGSQGVRLEKTDYYRHPDDL
jgi:hypothetical protein